MKTMMEVDVFSVVRVSFFDDLGIAIGVLDG